MLTQDDISEEQHLAIDRLYEHDETLLLAPKGFGKCMVAYTAISDLLADKVLERVLVLAPAQVCTETWALEAEKWEHLDYDEVAVLTGHTEKQRTAQLMMESSVVVANFELLPWLIDYYGKDWPFDGLLVDEITKLKSVGGTTFRKFRKYIPKFKWSAGLTADPCAQETEDIYGQMLVVDKGKALGRNKEMFLRKYFMSLDFNDRQWQLQPGGGERLAKAIEGVIYRVNDEQYEKDLPELRDFEIEVEMPDSTREKYVTLARDDFAMIGDLELEAPNAAVLQGKLHQMCNGSVYVDDEIDEGETVYKVREMVWLDSAKRIALDSLLAQSTDSPKLIAYQFDFERVYMQQEYGAPVYSSQLSPKKKKILREDWDAGEIPIMLVHPKSAGHGLNLQYGPCHTLICLSYFWSADMYDQLLGRLRRRGQASKFVNRYTFVTRNSVEDHVMKPRLASREESSERFDKYIAELKGSD